MFVAAEILGLPGMQRKVTMLLATIKPLTAEHGAEAAEVRGPAETRQHYQSKAQSAEALDGDSL